MMNNARLYVRASMAAAGASFLIIGSAAAVDVKVNVTSVGGTGQAAFSATSSNYLPFTGWSGETCSGKGNCVLNNITPGGSKTVVASFTAPLCTEFIYSTFSACQLDGRMYRNLLSAGPAGCAGGDPVLSWACAPVGVSTYVPPPDAPFIVYTYDPTASFTIFQPTIIFDSGKDVWVTDMSIPGSYDNGFVGPIRPIDTRAPTWTLVPTISFSPIQGIDTGVAISNPTAGGSAGNPIGGEYQAGAIPQTQSFEFYAKDTQTLFTIGPTAKDMNTSISTGKYEYTQTMIAEPKEVAIAAYDYESGSYVPQVESTGNILQGGYNLGTLGDGYNFSAPKDGKVACAHAQTYTGGVSSDEESIWSALYNGFKNLFGSLFGSGDDAESGGGFDSGDGSQFKLDFNLPSPC